MPWFFWFSDRCPCFYLSNDVGGNNLHRFTMMIVISWWCCCCYQLLFSTPCAIFLLASRLIEAWFAQEYHPEAPVLTPEIQEEMLIDPYATWSSCHRDKFLLMYWIQLSSWYESIQRVNNELWPMLKDVWASQLVRFVRFCSSRRRLDHYI